MVEDKYLVHPYLEYYMKFRFSPSLEDTDELVKVLIMIKGANCLCMRID